MRISDWSSEVGSSDLSSRDGRAEANQIIQDGLKAEGTLQGEGRAFNVRETVPLTREEYRYARNWRQAEFLEVGGRDNGLGLAKGDYRIARIFDNGKVDLVDMRGKKHRVKSEEHTSELQSLMRNSYAVFRLQQKNTNMT